MTTPVVFNPKLTLAGQAAAINASRTGVQLAITSVAFGTGIYDPTGNETALTNEVKRVSILAGAMVTPYQARITAVWEGATDDYPINEIGFFAGSTLIAVWSRSSGGPLGYKTPGIDFVLFNDLRFVGIPAGSIVIQVDESGGSAALAALGAHEAATDPHPGYVRKAKFPDAQAFLWCTIDETSTANAIRLTTDAIVTVSSYARGQEFRFKAAAKNTGSVTVNVSGLGPVLVKKNGGVALDAGDIAAGGVYSLSYDGANFFITGGVFGAAMDDHLAAADPHSQYVLKSRFPDATEYLWCATTGSTANALVLTTDSSVSLDAYGTGGKRFVFQAALANTGAVTVKINGKAVKNVTKNGANPLELGDIQAGAIYELIYDGTRFQIAGGVGGAALKTFDEYNFTATDGQTTFSFTYTPGSVLVFRNGVAVGFTGTNGSSINLSSACVLNDKVRAIAFTNFNLANAYTKRQARTRMYFMGQF